MAQAVRVYVESGELSHTVIVGPATTAAELVQLVRDKVPGKFTIHFCVLFTVVVLVLGCLRVAS